LSDRFDEAATSPFRLENASAGDPTTTVDIARGHFDRWQDRPWHEVLTTFARGEVEPVDVNRARWDRAYGDAAAELEQQFAPRFTAVRYEGLDAFGHTYLRQAQPELFGDPRWAVPVRPVLDRYYSYIDGEIGRAMRALLPGDLLFVISGFGLDPKPIGKRLFDRLQGAREETGTHEHGPDGFLAAYGTNVAEKPSLPRGSVLDLVPTVLYYMGASVARDMDGFVRTDLFLRYCAEHPVSTRQPRTLIPQAPSPKPQAPSLKPQARACDRSSRVTIPSLFNAARRGRKEVFMRSVRSPGLRPDSCRRLRRLPPKSTPDRERDRMDDVGADEREAGAQEE
jgi:hypothetical protein